MTHVERELERQMVIKAMRCVCTNDLRRVRAWYADLLENAKDAVDHERVGLRGEFVHAEIELRQKSGKDNPDKVPGSVWSFSGGPGKSEQAEAWRTLTTFPTRSLQANPIPKNRDSGTQGINKRVN